MLPDRVSNPGPLTYESGILPIALRGPAIYGCNAMSDWITSTVNSINIASHWLTLGFTLLKAPALGANRYTLKMKIPKSAIEWG